MPFAHVLVLSILDRSRTRSTPLLSPLVLPLGIDAMQVQHSQNSPEVVSDTSVGTSAAVLHLQTVECSRRAFHHTLRFEVTTSKGEIVRLALQTTVHCTRVVASHRRISPFYSTDVPLIDILPLVSYTVDTKGVCDLCWNFELKI